MTPGPGIVRRLAARAPSFACFAALEQRKEGAHAAGSSNGILIVAEVEE